MAKLLAGVTATTNTKFTCSDGRKFDDAKSANGWQRNVNKVAKFTKLVQDQNGVTFRTAPTTLSMRGLMQIMADPKLVAKLARIAK